MKILFATDGSAHAQQAAKFLAKLDFSTRYDLVIATLSHDPTLVANDHHARANEWCEQQAACVAAAHDEIEETLRGKTESVKRIHQVGTPNREIPIIAKKENIDLIVMGAIGHSTIRRLILGSVCDHIATTAECSVLIVRPQESESDEPIKRILVAYDGSKPATKMVDEIRQHSLSRDADLCVATVLQEFDFFGGEPYAEQLYERQNTFFDKQVADNEKAVAELKGQFPNVRSLVRRDPHLNDSIVSLAEQMDSQLVMVGDAGHTFWDDFILGSTSKYVLRHAPGSVWISRHHRTAGNSGSASQLETAKM